MSYNIRVDRESDKFRWSERSRPMVEQITFFSPDIIGLQEARPKSVDDISAGLPDYDHYGMPRSASGSGEFTTIFYKRQRFSLLDKTAEWCASEPDAAFRRTITRVVLRDRQSGRLLDIRNTHLDHQGPLARVSCAQKIEALPPARIDGKEAMVIVMGDFNSSADDTPVETLIGSDRLKLKNARAASDTHFGPEGTYNGFDIRHSDTRDIDHILVDRTSHVIRFGVLTDSVAGEPISDHFPIVTDIEFTSVQRPSPAQTTVSNPTRKDVATARP